MRLLPEILDWNLPLVTPENLTQVPSKVGLMQSSGIPNVTTLPQKSGLLGSKPVLG